jgi:hypothetical protein
MALTLLWVVMVLAVVWMSYKSLIMSIKDQQTRMRNYMIRKEVVRKGNAFAPETVSKNVDGVKATLLKQPMGMVVGDSSPDELAKIGKARLRRHPQEQGDQDRNSKSESIGHSITLTSSEIKERRSKRKHLRKKRTRERKGGQHGDDDDD